MKVRTLSGTRAVPSQKCDGWRNGMAGKMAGRVAGGAFIIGGKGPAHIGSLRTS